MTENMRVYARCCLNTDLLSRYRQIIRLIKKWYKINNTNISSHRGYDEILVLFLILLY
jgi:hypothetical protein